MAQLIPLVRENCESDTGRSYDPGIEEIIQREWVNKKMRERRVEYTTKKELRIVCGSWNVNGKKFDEGDGDLGGWLFGGSDGIVAEGRPDVFCLGFQEIVDLNAVNVAMEANTVKRSKEWLTIIDECLNRGPVSYSVVKVQYLVGLMVCVFVKTEISAYVTDVRAAVQGVGLMGVLGNKGGVGIRLNIFDNSYCFICAHLAAHRENVSGRNSDARNIVHRLIFVQDKDKMQEKDVNGAIAATTMDPLGNSAKPYGTVGAVAAAARSGGEPFYGTKNDVFRRLCVTEHEVVFFIGDLNYRIDERVKQDDIFESIKSGDERRMQHLRDYDQLNVERARRSGTVFDAFQEGVLAFSPTYKYQPGTDHYDQRPEKKVRAPAWCDRILWCSKDDDIPLRQVVYSAVNKYTCSDHKPVRGVFRAMARVIVPEKERQVYGALMQQIKTTQQGALRLPPVLEIHGATVVFPKFRYGETQTAVVSLRNSGQSVLHWRFIQKFGDDAICRPWIAVKPAFGLMLPGEIASITVTGTLGKKTISSSNSGLETLYDVLVLRVERSFDHYVRVVGNQVTSCFGMPLAALVMIHGPVRDQPTWRVDTQVQTQAQAQAQAGTPSTTASPLWVPKELWRLVNFFVETPANFRVPGLFINRGALAETVAVIEALDTGADFALSPTLPLAVANTLVVIVDALPTPVIALSCIPGPMSKRGSMSTNDKLSVEEAASLEANKKQRMQQLCTRLVGDVSAVHFNTFMFLVSFFKEVHKHCDANLLTKDRVVEVMSLCLLGLSEEYNSAAEKSMEIFRDCLHYMISVDCDK
jgi:phosphatidylinositol-bisphosphatase